MNKALFIITLAFLLFIIYSCKHEADKPSVSLIPSIKFVSGLNYIYNDTTLPKNSQFNVCLKAKSNSTSIFSLKQLIITREINSDSITVIDSIFNAIDFNYIYSFKSIGITGKEKWRFKIFDSKNNFDQITLNVTTKSYSPTISCIFNNIPYQVNQSFNIAVSALYNTNTYSNLNRFVISRSFENNRLMVLDSLINARSLSYFSVFTANSNPGTEKWTFRIYDKSNESDSTFIDVYTGDFMTSEHTGVIWNSLGGNNYSWDIVSNAPKVISDPDNLKDISNNTVQTGSYAPYYFQNSWVSLNSTLFKKANGYDYDNASVETAVDAYTGGTIGAIPRPAANGISEGDIFIGKLRNADNYTVIKITKVVFTTSDNNDNIQFSYKK